MGGGGRDHDSSVDAASRTLVEAGRDRRWMNGSSRASMTYFSRGSDDDDDDDEELTFWPLSALPCRRPTSLRVGTCVGGDDEALAAHSSRLVWPRRGRSEACPRPLFPSAPSSFSISRRAKVWPVRARTGPFAWRRRRLHAPHDLARTPPAHFTCALRRARSDRRKTTFQRRQTARSRTRANTNSKRHAAGSITQRGAWNQRRYYV
jgi:hypothetical protein